MKLHIDTDGTHLHFPVPRFLLLRPLLVRTFLSRQGMALSVQQAKSLCRGIDTLCKMQTDQPLLEVAGKDFCIRLLP